LGSAHPVQHPSTGDWVDFIGGGNPLSDRTTISAYAMKGKPSVEANREPITDVSMDTPPYMHSFGITDNHLIFPHMPIKFDMKGVFGKTMASALVDLPVTSDDDVNNAFYVAPITKNGRPAMIRTLPAKNKLYYIHTLNAYENQTGIVIDLTTLNENPFAGTLDTIDGQLNKTARDATSSSVVVVTRYLIPWSNNTVVTTELLSDSRKKTEFPKINPMFYRKKHCFYWANTWFTDLHNYASMAVIKQNVCSPGPYRKPVQWDRPHWYPSEPLMIPSKEANATEDEGLLVFTAVNGIEGKAYLITLDAKTMEVQSEAGPFPHIPYTAHGAFYPKGTWN